MKDDAISRQAVLKLLSAMPPEEATTKAMLIQSVKQMDVAQPEQRWIPCSERLPEHAGAYLVTTTVAVEKYVISTWYSPKGGWICDEHPDAWMPLPEPYKEVE